MHLRSSASALVAAASLALAAIPSAHAANQPPTSGGYAVGDINGDGFGDFTADLDYPQFQREQQILFGSAEPGPAKLLEQGGSGFRLRLESIQSSDGTNPNVGRFDYSEPKRIGDFDGDGIDDLFLDGFVGRSWVIYGERSSDDVQVAPGHPRVTTIIDDAGFSSVGLWGSYGIGDFNGDGRTDVMHPRQVPTSSSSSTFSSGHAVIVQGGPRVAQLDSRGTGSRRVQVNGRVSCAWKILVFLPAYQCNSYLDFPVPIGDTTGDGRADLYQSTGSFVIPGRAGTTTISGANKDALSISVPSRPAGSPWTTPAPTPSPTPTPTPTPSGTPAPPTDTSSWLVMGTAKHLADGVELTTGDTANVAAATWDYQHPVDTNELVVDFDLQLATPSPAPTAGPGNGVTLAFASPSLGGGLKVGNPGIGLGWIGNQGNAIVFGTVKGGLTPSNNYVAIANGVAAKSGYLTLLQSAPAVSPLANSTTHVTVRASGGIVTVALNGIERLRRTMSLPTDAYVGFTAGTSAARQRQVVRNVVIRRP
jgi:hypothetical protein